MYSNLIDIEHHVIVAVLIELCQLQASRVNGVVEF